MTSRSRDFFFRVFSLASAISAAFHAAAIVSETVSRLEYAPSYPIWRHLLFVVIDTSCASLFLRRPRWFVWAFFLLALQILNGHGLVVWTQLAERRPVDWLSVAVTLYAPIALWLLVIDWRARRGALARV